MKSYKTLFLDSTMMPISIIDWTKALTLYFRDKIIVLENYNAKARSQSFEIEIPSVVMTKRYVNKQPKKIPCTKENLYARDKGHCSYCGVLIPPSNATIDHIHPRSLGGKTSFMNCTLACKYCNNKKGNLTLKECKMKLINKPYIPEVIDKRFLPWFINSSYHPEQWKKYIK